MIVNPINYSLWEIHKTKSFVFDDLPMAVDTDRETGIMIRQGQK